MERMQQGDRRRQQTHLCQPACRDALSRPQQVARELQRRGHAERHVRRSEQQAEAVQLVRPVARVPRARQRSEQLEAAAKQGQADRPARGGPPTGEGLAEAPQGHHEQHASNELQPVLEGRRGQVKGRGKFADRLACSVHQPVNLHAGRRENDQTSAQLLNV